MVDDFGVKGSEEVPVLFHVEGFWLAGVGLGGFEDDEVVDFVMEFVESDTEPVEFGVYHEEIVDFSLLVSDLEWIPAMRTAERP